MKHGVAIFPTDYSMHPMELGRALEERGFESLWVAEHSHIPLSRASPWPGGDELPKMYYDTADPFVALSMAAAATTTLKLATGICLVVQRDPIHTAKSVASLDLYSGGRFLFGVGGGWNAEEMADHGTPFEGRWKLLRERIEAMQAMWTETEISYGGDRVAYEPFHMWPKPVQKPHPPIHVAGSGPAAIRRVVRYGNGWVPIGSRGFDPGDMGALRDAATEAGRDPDEIEVSIYYAPTDPDALAALAETGVDRVIFGLPSADADTLLPLLDELAQVP